MSDKQKKKIAVLGAGMSALSAVHEMTNYDGWQDDYEITVYVRGWRVGGKTATGRGVNMRIEEHGIHIMQGWYNNAFRLIQDVYAEREAKKLDPDCPIQTWKDAFIEDNGTLLMEYSPTEGRWINWPMVFPGNDAVPGDGPPLTVWQLFDKALALALEAILGSPYQTGEEAWEKWILDLFFPPQSENIPALNADSPLPKVSRGGNTTTVVASTVLSGSNTVAAGGVPSTRPHWWSGFVEKIEADYKHVEARVEVKMLSHVHDLVKEMAQHETGTPIVSATGVPHHETIIEGLDHFIEWLLHGVKERLMEDNKIRRIVTMLEFMVVNMKGILKDVYDPVTHELDFERIMKYDYREWIAMHGASQRVLAFPITRFMYTGIFQNEYGDDLTGGRVAAGTALRLTTLAFGYKGAFVFKFRCGTGETLITPIYQVLKARGVKFKFFQRVHDIHHSDTGEIERITIADQVTLKNPGAGYDPLVPFKGFQCWPAEPLYDQIDPDQARAMQAKNVDLENSWSDWTDVKARVMTKGTDFDEVLLAIPVSALKSITTEIMEHDISWKEMIENVKTTQTQSMQLWIKPNLSELGFDLNAWGMRDDSEPNTVCYQDAMYSWIDMSLIIDCEDWDASNKPGFLVYFCGALRDELEIPDFSDHGFPLQELRRVQNSSEQWLIDNAGIFWPNATLNEIPMGFDFRKLIHPSNPNASSYQRYFSQFFKANVDPSVRFTLSVPYTKQYRKKPDESGYKNLFLAGDWTNYGANAGYIEGAATSGLLAGQAMRKKFGRTNHQVVFSSTQDKN
ncbi:MAG: NAD(P)-binding protein [Bacteroidota bacterium]|nr:NAD(P)-binding protein [Bacteroidota bacterium]